MACLTLGNEPNLCFGADIQKKKKKNKNAKTLRRGIKKYVLREQSQIS